MYRYFNDFIAFELLNYWNCIRESEKRPESIGWKRRCWLFHLIEQRAFGLFFSSRACNVFSR